MEKRGLLDHFIPKHYGYPRLLGSSCLGDGCFSSILSCSNIVFILCYEKRGFGDKTLAYTFATCEDMCKILEQCGARILLNCLRQIIPLSNDHKKMSSFIGSGHRSQVKNCLSLHASPGHVHLDTTRLDSIPMGPEWLARCPFDWGMELKFDRQQNSKKSSKKKCLYQKC